MSITTRDLSSELEDLADGLLRQQLMNNDYCSGVLNEAAEKFLVTDDMKKEINLVTLRLKTIIEEESYLTCKKALMEKSGEFV